VEELSYLRTSLAIAALAGIPRERILNYRTPDEVRTWVAERAEGRASG